MMKQYINISKQVQSSGNFLMLIELKFVFSLINITMVLLTDYLVFVYRQSGQRGYSTFSFGMPKENKWQLARSSFYNTTMYRAKVNGFFFQK